MSSFVDANLESYNEKRTQNNWAGDYAKNLVDTHRDAGVIDHPDKSVSFEKLSGEVQNRITNLEDSAEKAKADLTKASGDINDAYSVAVMAMSSSESASETADSAKQKAENSNTTANAAQSLATAAHTLANIANNSANAAQESADIADMKAVEAQSTADTAESKADAAQSTADDNTTEITHKEDKKDFEYICTYTVARDSDGNLPNQIIISADDNGEPFELTDFSIDCNISTTASTKLNIKCNDVTYWDNACPGYMPSGLRKWGIIFLRYGSDGTGLLGTNNMTVDLSLGERYTNLASCMMNVITGSDTINKITITSIATFSSGTTLIVKGVRKR
ncbi:MAG: hypothetical protein PUF08_06830 [Clostridiales bacterium]|nr:hypothetical protein [Clostridiales bacterium]